MACASDQGYIKSATSMAAGVIALGTAEVAMQLALAFIQYRVQKRIAEHMERIANRKLALARAVHEHAKNFWPHERDYVEEMFSETKHVVVYSPGLHSPDDSARSPAFHALREIDQELGMQCLQGANSSCRRSWFHTSTSRVKADIDNFSFRFEENKTDAFNDRRFSRQYSALGLGLNVLSNINNFGNLASNAGYSNTQFIANSVNTALTGIDYVRGRMFGKDGWGSGIAQTSEQKFVTGVV